MEVRMGYTWEPYTGAIYGSHTWKQEWAICESNNRPYMEARMGHTRELYTGAIHGSKNGPHVRVIMGHTWKQEWAVHGSRTREPYMEARMGRT